MATFKIKGTAYDITVDDVERAIKKVSPQAAMDSSAMSHEKRRFAMFFRVKIASPESVVSGSLRRLRRRAGPGSPAASTLVEASF